MRLPRYHNSYCTFDLTKYTKLLIKKWVSASKLGFEHYSTYINA